MFIDTHCHLDEESNDYIENLIKDLKNNIIIVSGYNDESNAFVFNLSQKYNNVFCTLGIHPEEITDSSNLNFIENNITNKKVVGIGEIGLDYHYSKDTKELQKKLFIDQINLAKKNNKTVVVHSRDAASDTFDILKDNLDGNKCVMHCYSYSKEMALEYKKMNVKFGIGGVLTFKNSKNLKEVVENIELSDILLETDSPYLTPEPYRGLKNSSLYIPLIASKVAEIKGIDVDEVFNITVSNAIKQFDLNI